MKLTKKLRASILEDVMRNAYLPATNAIAARRCALLLSLYRVLVTPAEERTARESGERFVRHTSELRFVLFKSKDDQHNWINPIEVAGNVAKPMPIPSDWIIGVPVTICDAHLYLAGEGVAAETAALNARKQKVRDAMHSALTAASTVEQLVSLVPDVRAYLPKEDAAGQGARVASSEEDIQNAAKLLREASAR